MVKHHLKATLGFVPNNLGRIELELSVQKKNKADMAGVEFNLDTGSDFTTIDFTELLDMGYSDEFLKNCPVHQTKITTVAKGVFCIIEM